MKEPLLLSITEVAEALNVSTYTIRRLTKAGQIKSVKVGHKRIMISQVELNRVMKNGAGRPKATKNLDRREHDDDTKVVVIKTIGEALINTIIHLSPHGDPQKSGKLIDNLRSLIADTAARLVYGGF